MRYKFTQADFDAADKDISNKPTLPKNYKFTQADFDAIDNNTPPDLTSGIGRAMGFLLNPGVGIGEALTNTPTRHFIEGAFLGAGEGLAKSGKSVGDLLPEAIEHFTNKVQGRIPDPNLTQYGPQDRYAQLGHTVGDYGSNLIPGTIGFKAIKALPLISKLAPFLQNSLAAAGTGFALSEGDREKGALEAAVVPTLLKGAGKTGKFLYDKLNSRPYKSLINKIEQEIPEAQSDFDKQEAFLDALKAESEVRAGSSNPYKLQNQVMKLAERNKELAPVTQKSLISTDKALPPPTGAPLLAQSQKELDTAKSDVAKLLGPKLSHSERFAQEARKHQEGVEEEFNKKYNALEDSLKNKTVEVPGSVDRDEIERQVRASLGKSALSEDQIKSYVDKIQNQQSMSSPTKSMNGNELLKNYRNSRDLGYDAIRRLKESSIAGERDMYHDQSEKYFSDADKYKELLKNAMGEDEYNKFEELNRNYHKKVGVLKWDPIRKQMDKGNITGTITDRMKGDDLTQSRLQEIALSDPKISRLAIGQKYADNPAKILDADESDQKYINNDPELSKKVEAFRKSMEGFEGATNKAKALDQESARINAGFKEQIKQEKLDQKQINEYRNNQKMIEQKKVYAKKLMNQIKQHTGSKERLESLKKEYSENIQAVEKIHKRLWKILGYTTAASLGTTAIKKAISIFGND